MEKWMLDKCLVKPKTKSGGARAMTKRLVSSHGVTNQGRRGGFLLGRLRGEGWLPTGRISDPRQPGTKSSTTQEALFAGRSDQLETLHLSAYLVESYLVNT